MFTCMFWTEGWGWLTLYFINKAPASFSNLSQLITTNCSSLYYLSLPFLFPSEDCPLGTWWGPPAGPRLGPRERFRTIDWQVELMQIAPSWLSTLCWCWAGMPVFNFLTWPLPSGLSQPPQAPVSLPASFLFDLCLKHKSGHVLHFSS